MKGGDTLRKEELREFGAWMAKLREDSGVGSQDSAALKIGCSRVQLSRWESGATRIGVKYVRAIAELYNVEVNEVMKRGGLPIEDGSKLSGRTLSLARRIERRAADLPKAKWDAFERAIDNMLTIAT